MFDDIISKLVEERRKGQETIIKQAFLAHFGFPIDTVLHSGDLDIAIRQGSNVQQFRYKGECYLLWDESEGLDIREGVNCWNATLTVKYLFV